MLTPGSPDPCVASAHFRLLVRENCLTVRHCRHTSGSCSCTRKTERKKEKTGKLERKEKEKRKGINTEHKLHILYTTPPKETNLVCNSCSNKSPVYNQAKHFIISELQTRFKAGVFTLIYKSIRGNRTALRE